MTTSTTAWQRKFSTLTVFLICIKHDCSTFVIWLSKRRSESKITPQLRAECWTMAGRFHYYYYYCFEDCWSCGGDKRISDLERLELERWRILFVCLFHKAVFCDFLIFYLLHLWTVNFHFNVSEGISHGWLHRFAVFIVKQRHILSRFL